MDKTKWMQKRVAYKAFDRERNGTILVTIRDVPVPAIFRAFCRDSSSFKFASSRAAYFSHRVGEHTRVRVVSELQVHLMVTESGFPVSLTESMRLSCSRYSGFHVSQPLSLFFLNRMLIPPRSARWTRSNRYHDDAS